MASNFSTNFSGTSQHTRQEDDDILDLDAIIAQLGALESQLSCRESEIHAASDANQIAEKSMQLDRELSSVLQELSHLESSSNGYLKNSYSCGSIEPYSSNLDDTDVSHSDDIQPTFPHSESKNSFRTLSSQSSHSSSVSTDSGKSSQTLVRVYSPDGSSKTVAVDDRTTVGKVCEVLAKKHHVAMPLNWAIVECLPALHMERILEDHLLIIDQINLWTKDSTNRLIFVNRPEKYTIFNDHELRDAAANGSFSPNVDGFLHFKLDGKKTWKKIYFVLRASGLYYNPKGKGKAASDLICLQPLKGFDFYFGLDWKKYYRAPTEFGFALKLPMIQKEVPKFIRFFCVEEKKLLMDWVTAIRLVKHGSQLHDSFVRAQSWVMPGKHEKFTKAKSHDSLDVPDSSGWQDDSGGSLLLDERILSDTESEVVFTHSRNNSSEYGMSKKGIPILPITTSLTRHLSMQHQSITWTLPRSSARPSLPGFRLDNSPGLPSKDGDFMRFPSPDFSFEREEGEVGNRFFDATATLPRKSPNGMPLYATQSVRSQRSPNKYATLNTRQLHADMSPKFKSAGNGKLPSTITQSRSSTCGFKSQTSPVSKLNVSGLCNKNMSNSLEDVCENYGYLASTRKVSDCQDLPLPPPPLSMMQPEFKDDVASDQNLPLPPPPPELMAVNFGAAFGATQNSRRLDSDLPVDGYRQERLQGPPVASPTTPPAPPVRSSQTRLSFRGGNPRTHHIIRDFDRVMVQKQQQGSEGLSNLEIPLPPPPSYDEEYLDVDAFDLPPPPAEILESLKHMRNRPLPPIPSSVPASHRPMFSKVI